jgi:chaperonin GroES
MAANFVPLHDRILLRAVQEQVITKSGIVIPDTAKEKPQEAEVLAVGKGKISEDGKIIPLDIKTGDRVLFGKYSGTEIALDGEDYLVMREEEVLGVLAKSAKGVKSPTSGRKTP